MRNFFPAVKNREAVTKRVCLWKGYTCQLVPFKGIIVEQTSLLRLEYVPAETKEATKQKVSGNYNLNYNTSQVNTTQQLANL